MLVAIDESGSFVYSATSGAWCVVAAYVFSERRKTANLQALFRLKKVYGRSRRQEIKLKEITEADYFQFLSDLRIAGGALFAVAADSSLTEVVEIMGHKATQAKKIRANVPRMKYEEGKRVVATLADEIEALSPQLYVQLVCQVVLLTDVIKRAILFFVQRDPVTLRRFVWRIDQKNTSKSIFERSFDRIAPGLLQSESFRNPVIFLEGADYSHFQRYEIPADDYPQYLQEEFGHEPQSAVNIGKLIREDMKFPDSKDDLTVQIADLLAAGIRRSLRGKFTDGRAAAKLLGQLTIQKEKPKPSISLVMLSDSKVVTLDRVAEEAVLRMKRYAQPMVS
jgi:Protein of unknown function (DUF3800)